MSGRTHAIDCDLGEDCTCEAVSTLSPARGAGLGELQRRMEDLIDAVETMEKDLGKLLPSGCLPVVEAKNRLRDVLAYTEVP